jgi:hypothetical protein
MPAADVWITLGVHRAAHAVSPIMSATAGGLAHAEPPIATVPACDDPSILARVSSPRRAFPVAPKRRDQASSDVTKATRYGTFRLERSSIPADRYRAGQLLTQTRLQSPLGLAGCFHSPHSCRERILERVEVDLA